MYYSKKDLVNQSFGPENNPPRSWEHYYLVAGRNSVGQQFRKLRTGTCQSEQKTTVPNRSRHYYFHFDGLGNVVAISDSAGNTIEKYAYDVYGAAEIRNANGSIRNTSLVGNPYLFTGRRFDNETALYYYRARYYSPELGRFLQVDPGGYDNGINLYAYAGNNPIILVDPLGLCPEGFDSWSVWGDLPSAVLHGLDDGAYLAGNTFTLGLVPYWSERAAQARERYGGMATASEVSAGVSGVAGAGAATLSALGIDVVLWGGAATASNPQVQQGMQLWRVWGGESGPISPYWTNVNPQTVANYGEAAQLPAGNTQQFISTGTLVNTTNVIIQMVPKGSVPEVILSNPATQVLVRSVSGGG